MGKNLLKKLILITILFIIYCIPVFSHYLSAPPEIKDNSKCYIIKEKSNKRYICEKILNTPCYYDIIVYDSKNITIYCNFDNILVYNSTNINIVGSGNVITWNSSVSCQIVRNNVTYPWKFTYLYCLPIGVYAVISANETPLGALGKITVILYTNRNLSNVLVALESSCTSMIKPYYTSSPSEFIGSYVLFPSLKEGQGVLIEYYYVPQHGKECILSLVVKENVDWGFLQKTHKVNLTGESYAGYITVNANEILNLFIIALIAVILLLIVL